MALTKSLSFSLGRKRVLISNNSCNLDQFSCDFDHFSPMKRHCSEFEDQKTEETSPLLESLPQEILIKVICGVNHDDLKQLFHVSKSVRNATLVAKKSHFAYSTPTKTKVFKNSIDLKENAMEFDECEAPNAPKQERRWKTRARIDRKKIDDISIALFADEDCEEQGGGGRWPRRNLFM